MGTYGVVDNILLPRIVIDIHCNAPQRGHLCRQLREARVVLTFAFVSVRHIVVRLLSTNVYTDVEGEVGRYEAKRKAEYIELFPEDGCV